MQNALMMHLLCVTGPFPLKDNILMANSKEVKAVIQAVLQKKSMSKTEWDDMLDALLFWQRDLEAAVNKVYKQEVTAGKM